MVDIEKIKSRISDEPKGITNEIAMTSSVFGNKYIDGSELSIEEILVAIIYAYNITPDEDIYCPMTKKVLKKYFDWSDYKIRKMVKSIPEIVIAPMWDDEGYLCGNGYVIDELT